jgi:hypothetical protein
MCIGQLDRDTAEMNKNEAACFEPLKMALENLLSESPKACLEWISHER